MQAATRNRKWRQLNARPVASRPLTARQAVETGLTADYRSAPGLQRVRTLRVVTVQPRLDPGGSPAGASVAAGCRARYAVTCLQRVFGISARPADGMPGISRDQRFPPPVLRPPAPPRSVRLHDRDRQDGAFHLPARPTDCLRRIKRRLRGATGTGTSAADPTGYRPAALG